MGKVRFREDKLLEQDPTDNMWWIQDLNLGLSETERKLLTSMFL